MTVAVPVKGGTVGFADGHVAFCTACGWRGVATYPAHPRLRRRLRSRHYGHEHALTFCPACQAEAENDYDVAHGNAVTGAQLDWLEAHDGSLLATVGIDPAYPGAEFVIAPHVPAGTAGTS